MQEILERIKHVGHLVPECITCAFNKYSDRCPDEISVEKKVEYMQKVMNMMAAANRSTAIPVIIRDIDELRIKMFGYTDDYTEIKRHYNESLLEQIDNFRKRIAEAEDPLKLAIQLALVGNYIDFGVVSYIDEDFLQQMFEEAERKAFDETSYRQLKSDLELGGKLVYFTDNCGEIVMDRILMEVIKKLYPTISIAVVVRGMNTMNDATMEDAEQVGLTSAPEIDQVLGNGNNIMGTWFPEISKEVVTLIKEADVMIAKGQANFETMRRCGLNVYYLFLCKCDYYARMFDVPKMSGMLINDQDPKNN